MALSNVFLLVILLITESVDIGQQPAAVSAAPEWGKLQNGYLTCNTSQSSQQSEPWLYCVEEDCNHCNLWPDNIFTCSNSTGLAVADPEIVERG